MNDGHPAIVVGTSGWSYDHWRGPFFPRDLPKTEYLAYYGARFPGVEINNSFYQLPAAHTLENWREKVPDGFVFTAKASRYVTHMKKLKDPGHGLTTFLERITVLGDRLGPILFQLPPHWRFDAARLDAFLEALGSNLPLDRDFEYAFELRDHSWLNDHTYELLSRHGAALCIYDLAGFTSPKEVTADFIYVRLHGPGGPYRGCYDTATLAGWAGAFHSWAAAGCRVYCFFDNDEAGYAAANAARLLDMVS
ncbi:MAG: DUF72 domain-containing protein [Gammaproteobacteria bacterium]|nr:DUF72 domain-containing protein [Gammaproteobacteria bacterium]